MDHLSKSTFQFLHDIKANNNRDWFQAHKPRYAEAREELITFIEELMPDLIAIDSGLQVIEPKKTVFRIYRDVRFSKNKQPYKTHLSADLSKGSKTDPRAGFYLHIEPSACMIAGGAYMPSADWLKAIRKEIHYNADELKTVIDSKRFKKYFGEMEGEKLKTRPRDYPIDHPEIELLRHKSFVATHMMPDSQVTSAGFKQHVIDTCEALHPFCSYMNMALD